MRHLTAQVSDIEVIAWRQKVKLLKRPWYVFSCNKLLVCVLMYYQQHRCVEVICYGDIVHFHDT